MQDEVLENTETQEQTPEETDVVTATEENTEILESKENPIEITNEVLETSPIEKTDEIPPQNKKPKRKLGVGGIIAMISIVVALFITVCAFEISNYISSIIDQGYNSQSNDRLDVDQEELDRIVINLPVSDKPVIDPEYIADPKTGLLTTEGVAEKIIDSQVFVGCYYDNPFTMGSAGSGIILTSDGFILTNAHVIDGAVKIKVELGNGKQYEAEVIGVDVTMDIAVLKINATDLIAAELGNSDQAVLGEQVGIAGAGAWLENSISFGHISSLNREIKTDFELGGKLNCIQTTAALNPGNSGGALVNMYGQVIGIPVAVMDPSSYNGIGFAININDVIPVAEDLMKYGYVVGRARLGILYQTIDSYTAIESDIPLGLLIVEIDPASDLANYDVQVYDIITHVDGIECYDNEVINDIIATKRAGDTITLTIYRRTITDVEMSYNVKVKLIQK